MSPRDRRLLSDLRQMEELASAGEVAFRTEGSPAEVYHLMLTLPGLWQVTDDALAVRGLHRCDLYLHLDYPRRPPIITWLTPIFHPNILGPERNGGVCIGSWSAAESLADLCRRLCDLVAYRALNPRDALNVAAATWSLTHQVQPGDAVDRLKDLPVVPAAEVAVERA